MDITGDCIWAGEVHPFFRSKIDLLTRIITLHEGISQIILFGSVANGKCTPYSDIDLAVIGTSPNISLREYYTHFHDDPTPVDLLVYTAEEFSEEFPHLSEEISKGVTLWTNK